MLGSWIVNGQPFQPALAHSNCFDEKVANFLSHRPFSVLGTKFCLKDLMTVST